MDEELLEWSESLSGLVSTDDFRLRSCVSDLREAVHEEWENVSLETLLKLSVFLSQNPKSNSLLFIRLIRDCLEFALLKRDESDPTVETGPILRLIEHTRGQIDPSIDDTEFAAFSVELDSVDELVHIHQLGGESPHIVYAYYDETCKTMKEKSVGRAEVLFDRCAAVGSHQWFLTSFLLHSLSKIVPLNIIRKFINRLVLHDVYIIFTIIDVLREFVEEEGDISALTGDSQENIGLLYFVQFHISTSMKRKNNWKGPHFIRNHIVRVKAIDAVRKVLKCTSDPSVRKESRSILEGVLTKEKREAVRVMCEQCLLESINIPSSCFIEWNVVRDSSGRLMKEESVVESKESNMEFAWSFANIVRTNGLELSVSEIDDIFMMVRKYEKNIVFVENVVESLVDRMERDFLSESHVDVLGKHGENEDNSSVRILLHIFSKVNFRLFQVVSNKMLSLSFFRTVLRIVRKFSLLSTDTGLNSDLTFLFFHHVFRVVEGVYLFSGALVGDQSEQRGVSFVTRSARDVFEVSEQNIADGKQDKYRRDHLPFFSLFISDALLLLEDTEHYNAVRSILSEFLVKTVRRGSTKVKPVDVARSAIHRFKNKKGSKWVDAYFLCKYLVSMKQFSALETFLNEDLLSEMKREVLLGIVFLLSEEVVETERGKGGFLDGKMASVKFFGEVFLNEKRWVSDALIQTTILEVLKCRIIHRSSEKIIVSTAARMVSMLRLKSESETQRLAVSISDNCEPTDRIFIDLKDKNRLTIDVMHKSELESVIFERKNECLSYVPSFYIRNTEWDRVREFLETPIPVDGNLSSRVLFIIGSEGMGKASFARNVSFMLWESYESHLVSWIPVFSSECADSFTGFIREKLPKEMWDQKLVHLFVEDIRFEKALRRLSTKYTNSKIIVATETHEHVSIPVENVLNLHPLHLWEVKEFLNKTGQSLLWKSVNEGKIKGASEFLVKTLWLRVFSELVDEEDVSGMSHVSDIVPMWLRWRSKHNDPSVCVVQDGKRYVAVRDENFFSLLKCVEELFDGDEKLKFITEELGYLSQASELMKYCFHFVEEHYSRIFRTLNDMKLSQEVVTAVETVEVKTTSRELKKAVTEWMDNVNK